MLDRIADNLLKQWYFTQIRKPLLIRGARQVGKSSLVRNFCKKEGLNLIEVNFEEFPLAKKIFTKDLDADRLITDLEAFTSKKIASEKSLLFLDEIQEAPEALKALRYFHEKRPEVAVAASGSLLEFIIEKIGLPVGRLDLLYLYPLCFNEFVAVLGQENLLDILREENLFSISDALHEKFLDLLALYQLIGGMPETVQEYVDSNDLIACQKVNSLILNTYKLDFHKYAKKNRIHYVEEVFDAIPRFLSQRFKYSFVSKETKSSVIADAVTLLDQAGVISKCYHSAANGLPLGADKNNSLFKAFFLDIGLAAHSTGVNLREWTADKQKWLINKGGLCEQFVASELIALNQPHEAARIFHWRREKAGSMAEVDFVTELAGHITPIEVKSGNMRASKSLHVFMKERPLSKLGIEFSLAKPQKKGVVIYLPLYAVSSLRDVLLNNT